MKSLSLAAIAALLVLGACSSSPTATAAPDASRRTTVETPGDWGGALGSGTLTPDPVPGDTLPTDENGDNGGGFLGSGGGRTGGGFLGSGGG
ncbi:hypothetical protein [Longimicrobium terrae]|uniref:Lipoprotein n=1 Tax=Longimicrobium terrae TaxID=1639882 RepID=A0A841H577_9BACT|nr:hypothetical protein [Longimicrobium terrae]MBB4638884.1 hypothetical protein [Longimicrobium terrae]MBB6073123.1 hypothetical protein [Longimicrobium terrae]NNC30190.1 hypothetical protein [Longimicrobium terrae]